MSRKIREVIGVSLLILSGAIPGLGQVSVLTQHNDSSRTGQNTSETTLNTSNVNKNTFGKLFYRTVDGLMFAQPLYVPGLTIGGATHNVVFVATAHNSVYAFDADDPNAAAPLWQVNLGAAVPMEDICIITGDTNPQDCPYYDISPEIGIISTPAIDPAAGIIYVVARTKNTSNSTYHFSLHALSLTTGSEELGGPMEITGQVSGTGTASVGGIVTFDPTYVNQRPSLLFANGVLYIAFGSVGDIGPYHGWVMSYNATTLQQEGIFNVTPNGSDGGIWSAGQGLVADASNNVYAITSNGDFTANTGGGGYGDSYLKFTGPSLTVGDYFTPDNQGTLNADNTDLGSGGPMLMPGTSLLVGIGKDGIFRVLNTANGNMGKYNAGVDNDVQEFQVFSRPFFSSPIYWNSPNHGPLAYTWEPGDVLKGFAFNGSLFSTTPATQGTVSNANGFSNAAALSVSSSGSLTGTGILWTSRSISGTATGAPVPGVIAAYDATNVATELWDSTQNLARDDVGTYAKYNPPTVANGKVYVGSFSGQLQVYGLNPPAFQGIQFVQVASATPQSSTASVPVTFTGAQTTGNLNVVIVGWHDTTAAVQSVTDSAGNTYTRALGPTTGTGLSESIYYAKNILGSASNTVTVTFNQAASKPDVRILEYSGADTSNPLDVSIGASGNSNIADSGFVSTTAANELIVGADVLASGTTTIMAGAPYTSRTITTTDADLAADRIVNVPGSYNSWAPLTASGAWIMQTVTFRSATASTVPFVTGVSPSQGLAAGGTAVTISGIDFAAGATVTFGSASATNVVVVNSTTITATTPAGSAGPVTVTVTNSSGQSGSLSNGFTYIAAPTVTSVSPNNGSTSGGTAVTITGTNFVSGATVTFGSAAATNVVVVNSTSITATTPAGSAGAVTVTVTVSGQSGSLASGFTYVVRPTVSSVSPNSGVAAGGTAVTITGTNFAAGATVTFGSASATNVVVVNSTSITATTPAGAAGAVTVTVTVNGQSGSLTNGFTYVGQPTVTSVSPNNGPAAGGTGVTITGTNFGPGATVTFGSAAATNVVVVSGTSITATTPAGSVGAVTVTVTNIGSQSGTLPNGYTYNAAVAIGFGQVASSTPQSPTATVTVAYPAAQTAGDLNVVVVGWNDTTSTVQSVRDSVGNTYALAIGPTSASGMSQSIYYASNISGGSNTVTVTFSQAAAYPDVRILEYRGVTALDAKAAATGSSATSNSGAATTTSANELIFGANMVSTTTTAAGSGFTSRIITVPDGDIAEDEVVTTAGSYSATATLGSGAWIMQMVTFSAVSGPAPTVASVSPNNGSTAGGTAVTITGTNFVPGDTVTFGAAAATNVVVVNSTTITATTPAGSAGATTVTVTNTGGQSGSLASAFTYVAPPTVTSVSPNNGPAAGGTAVTITGTNFAAGATVKFGSTAATNVVVVNSTSITATTPAGSVGAVTVTVTNSNGLSGSLASGFTYVVPPTVTSVSPNNGSTTGGTAVTITGTNFVTGATVTFGSAAATNVVIVNSTSITATTPAGSAGAVTVTVTNVGSQSGSLANGFTYVVRPTVSSVSPNSGVAAGGTAVTITGTNFAAGATVTFGSASATNVVVVNSTSITATTPAGSAGAVTVTVTVSGQSGSLTNGFTYVGQPTVTSVSPNNGPAAGGTGVTITGTNFGPGATVTFGSAAATNVVVVSGTSITATTPAGSVGAVTVTVTNIGSQSGTLPNGYTYNAAVAIGFGQVASSTPQSPTATVTVAYPAAQTAGDLNVVVVGWNDTTSTVQSVRDSVGNTYALAIGPTSASGMSQSIYYASNISGGSNTVTVTFSQAAAYPDVRILEYRGVTALDAKAAATGSSATSNSGAATTTSANELIFGANMVSTTTTAAGSGFTSRIITVPDGDIAEDEVVTTAGSYSATATLGSGAWIMQMVTFSAVSGPAPTVASVSPNNGSTAGGTAVTITGTNFVPGDTVTFGAAAATNVVVVNSTTITATTPTGSAGATTVTVTNTGGQSGSLASAFTYVAPPTVTSVSPNNGPAAGGTAVTITGTNFAAGATVKFGSTAATNVVVVNSTSITATTPAGSVGAVTVTVTNSNGLSGSLASGFTYVVPPTVTSVSPNNGSTTGGTAVTITGTNFVTGATVTFGSAAATNVVIVNSTSITATTPAGSAGAVTVTVTNVGSQSGSLANGFTYVVRPTVSSVSPNSGVAAGGTAVTITGTNFAAGATVTFGSASATNVVVVNSTSITATTPAGSAGAVTVTVTVSGQSGSLTNGFTYVVPPTVTSVSPNNGPTTGGTAVTITGTNFVSGATVTFGSAAATNVVVVNSTSITATTPAGSAGAVTVTVTVSGQSGSLASGFTYVVRPTVSSVSPNSGVAAGGTAVTITGTNFAAGATVTFGSASATNVVVVNSTSITATTPAGAAGAVTVTVTVNGQSGSLTNGFTYVGQPTVTSVSPNNGPAAGGTGVTITGTNFGPGATVTFGSAAATNVVVVSGTSITATTPAGSVGAVTVTVTNIGSQSGTLPNGYTYNAAVAIGFGQVASSTPQSPTATVTVAYPAAQTAGDLNVVVVGWNDTTSTVQSVRDSVGNTYALAIGPTSASGMSQSIYYASNISGGSNTVTVTFSQAAAYPDVRILEYRGITALDAKAAATGSSATSNSGAATTTSARELIFGANMVATSTTAAGNGFTSRIITVPDGDIAEDEVVTTAGSYSATATLGSGAWIMQMVTFVATPAPVPTVSSVSPNNGSTAGGTAVTITGTNFAAGATVTFGSTAATNVVVVNSTTITATTPAASAGEVMVTVTNTSGQSGSLANAFTYVPPPTVSSISPISGVPAGGTAVTITGTNFAVGATVTFGAAAATNVVVVNSTTITATSPAGSAGAVTVKVTNSNGLSGSLASAFTYVVPPTVSSVSPNNGSTAGGTTVTITGANFATGAAVTFGAAAAANVVVVNSTTITAMTPAGVAGAVAVTVTVTGQSGSLASGFTYIITNIVTAPSNFTGALAGSSVPTYVSGQQYYNATAGTSFTSAPFNSTGADLLVMFLGSHNNTVFTITDNFGNTWLPLAGPAYNVGTSQFPREGELFYVPNAVTGAGHTITVTNSQLEPLVMSIAAIAGDNFYSPIDTYSLITADPGTRAAYIASSPLTTSQPNDLLLGIVKGFGNNTYTAGTGYTSQPASTGQNFGAETRVAASMGSYSSSFTASNNDFWQTILTAVAPKPNETVLSWIASAPSSNGGPIATYYIERCASVGCSNFSQIASVSASTLTYTDTSIAAGTAYAYRVRAQDSSGTYSTYSSVQAVTPIVPQVVAGFVATAARKLSWNASTENGGSISQYSIERCTGLGCSDFAQIANTSATSYTDTSAPDGATYNYRVRAQDANSFYGPYSAIATASIPAYFDNAANGGNNGGSTTSFTYSYTVGTNSNRLLLVNLMGDVTADDISSVTYAGAPMTLVKKVKTPNDRWHYLYYLLSPASGTNNVVITAASAHYLISEASSWYNIAQSGQPQASATNTGAAGTVSLTASLPASSNDAIVAESMWGYTGIIPFSGSAALVVNPDYFSSLGMFSSVPSPVTEAYPISMTNTWGGQASASAVIASFSLASSGPAGITFDNSVDGGNNGGSTTSLTYSYTVGSGSNRLLVVNLVGDTPDDITSVTYNGASMTLLGKAQAPSNNRQYMYYLLNPASGTHNIVITAGSSHYLISEAASWSNVNQSGQPDAVTTNTAPATSTSITTSLTTVASGSLVLQGIWSYDRPAAGVGATPIVIDAAIDGAGIFVSSGSPVSPAGNVSMTTVSDGSTSTGVIMASFAPAP